MTLFPAAFVGPLDVSIVARARRAGLLDVHLTDIREFAPDRHRSVDDYPFGGGQGMVMRADVLDMAFQHVRTLDPRPGTVIYLSPQGEKLSDSIVRELATQPRLILVSGRYEGVDERFLEHCVDREISIGDYILTGGELPAMVLIDAVTRHLPGALGDQISPEEESFAGGLLEYPQYTRPAEYRGWKVPGILLSGDHARIATWRQAQRLERTRTRRPDLLEKLAHVRGEFPVRRPMQVEVRDVDLARDEVAVLELWASAVPYVSLGARPDTALLSVLNDKNPGLLLVAETRGRLAGFAAAGFDGYHAQLYLVAVAPRYRGRRVAAALMSEMENRLRARGCGQLHAHVVGGNPAAVRFCEREGWDRSWDWFYAKCL